MPSPLRLRLGSYWKSYRAYQSVERFSITSKHFDVESCIKICKTNIIHIAENKQEKNVFIITAFKLLTLTALAMFERKFEAVEAALANFGTGWAAPGAGLL